MEILGILFSLLFFGLPLYYAALVIFGWGGKSRVPVWAAASCLGLWLAQIPLMVAVGLGCAGGGCSGARSTVSGLLFLCVFDVAPLWWLMKAFPKDRDTPQSAARDPVQIAEEARGFPVGFNPHAEAGNYSRSNAPRPAPGASQGRNLR